MAPKRRAKRAPARKGSSYKKTKNKSINITVNATSGGGGGYPVHVQQQPSHNYILDEVRKIMVNQAQHPSVPQIFAPKPEVHLADRAKPEYMNRPLPGIIPPEQRQQQPQQNTPYSMDEEKEEEQKPIFEEEAPPTYAMEEEEQQEPEPPRIKQEEERRIVVKKEKKKSIIDPKDELRMVVDLDRKRPNEGQNHEEEYQARRSYIPSNRKLEGERITDFSDKYVLAISVAKRKAALERQKQEAKERRELKQHVKKEELY